VVGVVGNVDEAAQDPNLDMRAAWYIPCAQQCNAPGMTFTLRTRDAPPDLDRRVTAVIHRADPDLAVFRVVTLTTRLAETFDRELLTAILLAVFALAGVTIALAGVYAVASISVAARYRDIGIRVALGAQPRRVAWALLWDHLRLFALGLVLAAPILWLGQRWAGAGLSTVGGASPAVLVAAPLTLTLLGCLALLAPALLIMRVDPVRVLKEE
jgi:putative ABC transport system permease protein